MSGLTKLLSLNFEFEWSKELDVTVTVGRFVADPALCGPFGVLHGGIAIAALDETMGAAAMHENEGPYVTARIVAEFRHAVPLDGSSVEIRAWCTDPPRRARRIRGVLRHTGKSCVEASALFARPRG
jgi:acyl-coenzyme A thioesterase PaaI-like protein